MFHKPQTNRISRTLNLLAIILSLLAIPALPLQAQQPSQPSAAPRPELALQIGHRGFIEGIALSPDGKTAASISFDRTLKLWDAQSGDLLHTVPVPEASWDKMRFSADGKTIEVRYKRQNPINWEPGRAVYDLQTRELKLGLDARSSPCPDKTELVVAAPDKKVAVCLQQIPAGISSEYDFFLWDTQTKQKAHITKSGSVYDLYLKFSPDGQTIAISQSHERGVVFWDVTTRQAKRRWNDRSLGSFSPDGQMIVLEIPEADRCSCPEDNKLLLSDKAKLGAVELWDAQLKAAKRTLIGREFVGYSPDGQTILLTKKAETATAATLELWDAQLKAAKRTLIGREFFGYTPDGQTILLTKKAETATTATLELWDAQLGRLKQTLSGNLPSFSQPLYSPDGRIMALPSETNLASETGREEVILYDLQAGKIINRLPTGPLSGFGEKIAFSQDGATLTTLGWSGEAKLWDARTGTLRSTLKTTQQKTAGSPSNSSEVGPWLEVIFSADGQMVIFGTQSGVVVILNFRTGRVIQTVALPTNSGSPDFSASNQTIIQAEPNLPAMEWDLRTLQPRPFLPDNSETPGEKPVETRSPDGRLSAKLSGDRKSAALFDARTGKLLHTFDGHSGSISAVIFTPDNRTVATVSGFPELDLLTGIMAVVVAGDKKSKSELDAEVNKLTGDRTIKLWDAQTGQLKQTLKCDGAILQARFLPDDSTIIATHSRATSTKDLRVLIEIGAHANSFTLWNVQTGKSVKTVHAEVQASFLLSPDDSLAISGGSEIVKAWDTRTGELKWEASEVDFDPLGDNPFTPDGKLLVVKTKYQDLNSAVKLLDVQTGQVRWTLPRMYISSFSPDGQSLICLLGGKGVSLWDVETRKLKWSIPITIPARVPFLADGKLVAIYGQHYAIELRDARDGKLLVSLLTMPGVGQANEKGETAPEWIAFTPEGYYSASPGAARYIRWRVGDKLLPAETYTKEFNRPDLVQKALQVK